MALALITGASSGIGLELARVHAQSGGDVILVARSEDKLQALKGELEAAHGIKAHVYACDLSAPGAAEKLYNDIKTDGHIIDYLINNAGFGGHGKFHERPWAQDDAMIALNIRALTALTRKFLDDMVARGSGRILNVASMAGFLPGPLQAVYYATKAYVLSFSEAISNELSGTGVSVTVLCPGATDTPFLEAANLDDIKSFKMMMMPVRPVAEYGYKAMLRGKRVAVPGWMNKFTVSILIPLLPRSWVLRISRQSMEKG